MFKEYLFIDDENPFLKDFIMFKKFNQDLKVTKPV